MTLANGEDQGEVKVSGKVRENSRETNLKKWADLNLCKPFLHN